MCSQERTCDLTLPRHLSHVSSRRILDDCHHCHKVQSSPALPRVCFLTDPLVNLSDVLPGLLLVRPELFGPVALQSGAILLVSLVNLGPLH